MIYYNKDGFIVRDSTEKDVDYLKDNLRQSDIKEIWRSHHYTPEKALGISLKESVICLTILKKDEPLAMFGIIPETFLGSRASVWMLATDKLCTISKRFLRNCGQFIKWLLGYYPYLFNWVDIENMQSIKWLIFCGAVIGEAKPYGMEKTLFQYFYFERIT